ncbi:MAG TPA: hypothetical protein VLY46_06900 [Usitatibacter sp.]|nr:hypothetical protein [Usitatibacter sp.]
MEDRMDPALTARRAPRSARCEEVDEELGEESHVRGRMRELLLQRERATERFRALKRRLLGRR